MAKGRQMAGILSDPSVVSRAAFRDAMSRVATAVHIVTSDGVAGLAGITANSVASVSDSPPIMLVCVSKASHSAPRFLANRVFCINTLAASDLLLAEDFAGRTGLHLEARFTMGQWHRQATGAPVLASAITAFECRLVEVHDVASHHVLIGEVMAIHGGEGGACLAYHDRKFVAM